MSIDDENDASSARDELEAITNKIVALLDNMSECIRPGALRFALLRTQLVEARWKEHISLLAGRVKEDLTSGQSFNHHAKELAAERELAASSLKEVDANIAALEQAKQKRRQEQASLEETLEDLRTRWAVLASLDEDLRKLAKTIGWLEAEIEARRQFSDDEADTKAANLDREFNSVFFDLIRTFGDAETLALEALARLRALSNDDAVILSDISENPRYEAGELADLGRKADKVSESLDELEDGLAKTLGLASKQSNKVSS